MSTEHDTWLAERLTGVGASEMPAVLGIDPSRSPFALWAEKTGRAPREDFSTAREVFWGTQIEPVLAQVYAEQTGRTLIDHGRHTIRRGAHPVLFATLDREIADNGDGWGPGVYEGKNADDHLTHAWEDGAPLKVQVQVQTQLAVTGYRWGIVGVLPGGNDDRYFRIDRNDELIEVIEDAATTFWQCVRDNVPPDVDGAESTREAIKRIYPQDSGREIELPAEAAVSLAEWERASEEVKKWETAEREAKNRIAYLIGDASVARLGDVTLTYKTQRRKETVVAASEFRVLRRKGRK